MTRAFVADPSFEPPESPGRPFAVDIEGPPSDPARVWRLLGDTDQVNRIGGNGVVRSMALRTAPDGLPALEVEIASRNSGRPRLCE